MRVDKELPGIILVPGLFSARADDLILQFCLFFFSLHFEFHKIFWELWAGCDKFSSLISDLEHAQNYLHSQLGRGWGETLWEDPEWDQQRVGTGNGEREENPG